MAVALEFIDFIVPVSVIKAKYPGGWNQCLTDHRGLIGGRVWFDDYLFRDGAMNPLDIETLVEEWTSRGFTPYKEEGGRRVWKDMCVAESMFGGATLSCDWIELASDRRSAFLKGTEPGPIIDRSSPVLKERLFPTI